MPYAIAISNTVSFLRAIKAPLATTTALLLCLQAAQAGAVERINTKRVKQRAKHFIIDAMAYTSRVFNRRGPFANTLRAVDETPSAGVPLPLIGSGGMPFLSRMLTLGKSNGTIFQGQAGFIIRHVWGKVAEAEPTILRVESKNSGDLSLPLRHALTKAVLVSELLKETAGIPSKEKPHAPVVMNKHQAPVIMNRALALSIATLLKKTFEGNKKVAGNPSLAKELATALDIYFQVCGEADIKPKEKTKAPKAKTKAKLDDPVKVADAVLEFLSSGETHKSPVPQ